MIEGGIHNFTQSFPDSPHWLGRNFTFDASLEQVTLRIWKKPPQKFANLGSCADPGLDGLKARNFLSQYLGSDPDQID